MLFKQNHLTGIKEGRITLAFRKWKKPTVKKGSLLKTPIGQVEINNIDETTIDRITNAEAIKAGFTDCAELINHLATVEQGTIYKISLRYLGEDPRIGLREKTTLTQTEFASLKNKLDRFDAFSKQGNWTLDVLLLIRDHPEVKAAVLARKIKKEKDWLKINIRKLKNLGLTISHEIGYSLSPLGLALLQKLKK
jgi:hypothetical protein